MTLFPQMLLDLHDELIVDLFAGGGGASSGIEQALGRQVDIAINHDAAAVSLHQANHPQTQHFVSDVFEVDPREVTKGRPAGLLWASPDCTFHSKARGGKPIRSKERKRRALAWVVTRWAGQVRPRVIMLENVEEFAEWGPLVGPPHAQRPCPRRRGRTFRKWVRSLERLGYQVEWRELRACDYGAPTIRKRLFLIARCDGEPIVWPAPTHGPAKGLKPYRTAAECIDWSIPMLSIFATREEAKAWGREQGQAPPVRPLADATMRRIARGVMRYVVESPKPYIVGVGGRQGQSPERPLDRPMQTVTAKGDSALVAPVVVPVQNAGSAAANSGGEPLRTITAHPKGGGFALAAAVVVPNNTNNAPHGADEPLPTVTGGGRNILAAPYLVPRYGERAGQEPRTRSIEEPSPVVVPSGNGASLVSAFLAKYYGTGDGAEVSDPSPTVTTKDRFGLVTVTVAGEPYVIADIAMRMLQPRELYRAQGFRDGYIIDRGADGRRLTKTEQVRMVGNSVCPPMAEALVGANLAELVVRKARVA